MSQPGRVTQLLSIGLLSGAAMLLELALTRVVSALYFPQYVFAVLALAVLGIGLGAAAAAWSPALRTRDRLPAYLTAAAIATGVLLFVLVATPLARILGVVVVLLIVPYACIGLSFPAFFSSSAQHSPTLYLADLIGAGAGAVLAIIAMNGLGPVNSILLAALLFCLSAAMLSPQRISPRSTIRIGIPVLLLLTNLRLGWLSLDLQNIDAGKPLADVLAQPGAQVLDTRWDAFSRTDLVQPAGDDFPRLYMDGAAGSIMPPAVDESTTLISDIGFFPFATDQPERVLLIGPGGGLDVWFALQSQAREIVAVEVNPASIDLVRQYGRFNGDLYRQPTVQVITDDGRSALQRDRSRYDLIFLSNVVTLTAERTGFALSENTLYTVEAFTDYWAHLSDRGVIALKLYDDLTAERGLSTALAMLEREGFSNQDALRHMIILADPAHDPPIPLLMIRRQPYTREDSLVYGRILRGLNFSPLFLPELWVQPPLDAVWNGSRVFADVIAGSSADISPTTDDSPYFYQFERGLPQELLLLLGVLAVVLLLAGAFIGYAQRAIAPGPVRVAPLFFLGLGAAFIMVEVAMIQQTRVFLGHPTLAITVVLATLLIGSGVGSGIGGRWLSGRLALHWQVAVLVALLLAWMAAWSPLSAALSGAGLETRIAAVILTVLPVAVAMGLPFSQGLRIVGSIHERLVALAWVANSVMTVVGTVLAVALSILSGFSLVMLLGVVVYAFAATIAYVSFRGVKVA